MLARILKLGLATLTVISFVYVAQSSAEPKQHHALWLVKPPKYGPDATQFSFVNPNAPKGGRARLWSVGAFDSLNSFSFKGQSAAGLTLIYDRLMAPNGDEPGTLYGLIAEWASFPDDYSSVTFKLRDDARWHDGKLWVLNSGTGHLGTVDLSSGLFEPLVFMPGFVRGLAFHNNHAIVGLSLPRDGTFAGLQLDEELKKRDADPWCGVQVINLSSGDVVEWIRFETAISELLDVCVLPGVRLPSATAPSDPNIAKFYTIDAGPAAAG